MNSNLKVSLWRTGFFAGLGGSISSIVILYVLNGKLPFINWIYFILCAIGLVIGLYETIVHKKNPFKFLENL